MWEGGHREPAIAWWPGRIEPGSTTDETVMTMDLFPTFAELADVPTPVGMDGATLAPVLLKGESIPDRDLFWRMDEDWAVRRGPWKLVHSEGEQGLYNLDDDIGETTDVSADNPELVEALAASFKTWEQDVDGK